MSGGSVAEEGLRHTEKVEGREGVWLVREVLGVAVPVRVGTPEGQPWQKQHMGLWVGGPGWNGSSLEVPAEEF